jgi:hypothetical protein
LSEKCLSMDAAIVIGGTGETGQWDRYADE